MVTFCTLMGQHTIFKVRQCADLVKWWARRGSMSIAQRLALSASIKHANDTPHVAAHWAVHRLCDGYLGGTPLLHDCLRSAAAKRLGHVQTSSSKCTKA